MEVYGRDDLLRAVSLDVRELNALKVKLGAGFCFGASRIRPAGGGLLVWHLIVGVGHECFEVWPIPRPGGYSKNQIADLTHIARRAYRVRQARAFDEREQTPQSSDALFGHQQMLLHVARALVAKRINLDADVVALASLGELTEGDIVPLQLAVQEPPESAVPEPTLVVPEPEAPIDEPVAEAAPVAKPKRKKEPVAA